ncbi:DUF4402 domain-containing protein [Balneolaceae bacterium ANBcel3]|nr:DUF4402 domain-containing protein [Balneolaceae bacterium ANBcel3]
MYKRFILLLVLLLLLGSAGVQAQNNALNNDNDNGFFNIAVSASVLTTDVTVVTIRDLLLDQQVASAGTLQIDPQNDFQAGKLRAEGRPNAEVRISFLRERELSRTGGQEQLLFMYAVSGNDTNDQPSSELLDLDNRDFQLNDDGEFFFWVGGTADISGAVEGSYDGEFTIEIEYL